LLQSASKKRSLTGVGGDTALDETTIAVLDVLGRDRPLIVGLGQADVNPFNFDNGQSIKIN